MVKKADNRLAVLIREVLLKGMANQYDHLPSAFCPVAVCFCESCKKGCLYKDTVPLYYKSKLETLVNRLSIKHEKKRELIKESIESYFDAEKQNKLVVELIFYYEALGYINQFILNNIDNIMTDEQVYGLIGVENKETDAERFNFSIEQFNPDELPDGELDRAEMKEINLKEPEF